MNSISTSSYLIHFNTESYLALNTHLKANNYSKVFVLVDQNTHEYCFSHFLSNLETHLEIEIIEIEAGEINKNIETCSGIWNALSELDADRKSLLINLGGGVITDIGGFVASTFKRGITYIQVPTTLLSMVDASIGGKTGVDLGHLKNQIGVINTGAMVLIDTSFLNTLPNKQMRSGLAEMLKHGLIYSREYWNKFTSFNKLDLNDLDQLIYESIEIKNSIVEKDPLENNLRKTLNYGHTLGHAIESYYLSNPSKTPLLHGEAVAIGMVLATYISTELCKFPKEECHTIKDVILSVFGQPKIANEDLLSIIELLKFDKKNEHGNINFVLLEAIGKPKINCQVENNLIIKAFKYYNS
ncbi:3-dehydroquinate synthase [Xanthomarina sp. F2636L]|uniref:3-dehydroquinate synthase n=1 Tax=Xanthomarina sp. F2636L TaxID=2996018 RepID=UPI00225E0AEC|nr:3-dehydroquinate synthase [Xanthomarina sp. F2636L]MCX7549493.1 3-dehydroquinate synthase [Xanthomarina sp. F2636L]